MTAEILQFEEYAVGLLLVATIVGILASRYRMPYTVGLVVVGTAVALAFNANDPVKIPFAPELILSILIPPLVFEAAFHLPFHDLQRNIKPILVLAIAGVLVTMLLVGFIVNQTTLLPLSYALMFGAIIAATDPVAVIALFRTLGVPKRLQVLLEGESLLNDGTAIVVFHIVYNAILQDKSTFNFLDSLSEFLRVAGGGLAIGLLFGWLISLMIARVDDHLIETALTFALAYGSYAVAETAHVSGVLAVVAAGIINGNIGPRGMAPTTRVVVFNFWEFMSFIANSFVFLLIGLVIDIKLFEEHWQAILWGIAAALIARAIVIYGFFPRSRTISTKWKHILYWGGLRGAISLALVLSLGESPHTGQIKAMVFGLVLFNLLFQGTSMSALVKKLNILLPKYDREEYDLRRARAVSTRAGYERLRKIQMEGMISSQTWQAISNTLHPYMDTLTQSVQEVLDKHPEVKAEELDSAWREFLHQQRNTLNELFTDHSISEDTYGKLTGQINSLLDLHEIQWKDMETLDTELWKVLPRPTALTPESD